MKGKLQRLSICLLYFQTYLSLACSEKMMAVAGRDISLPCGMKTEGDVQWFKNNALLVKYIKHKRFNSNNIKDINRFRVPTHDTNDLEVTNIQLSDSGTFTCLKEKSTIETVELFVFEVSALPSTTLLSSEDLKFLIKPSLETVPALQVFWKKDGNVIENNPNLVVNNVQIKHSGTYICHIKMDGGNEVEIPTKITVNGLEPSPAIVYMTRKQPVTIPWTFNFNVRVTPLASDVSTVEGKITYASQIIQRLTVSSGAANWPDKWTPKTSKSNELSINLSNPKTGHYQMEILLKIQNRLKRLWRDVCVANLTVSISHGSISMESIVTLLCNINCIDKDGKLCWYQPNIGNEICGQVGEKNLTIANPETKGNWICSVIIGKERLVSANLTLEVTSDFLDMSNYLFWVTVGVGVLLLLLIVVTVTIMTARCRRVRRARYRAWLIQNLHQQRRCECKGFAPKLLRDNV